MEKKEFKVSEILQIAKMLEELHSADLKYMVLLDEDDNPIKICEKTIDDWAYTGLNNFYFIKTGAYLLKGGLYQDNGKETTESK